MVVLMKKNIPLIVVLCLICSCSSDSGSPGTEARPPEKITISGAGNLGVFDPSVERDQATGRTWMSYSSVDTSGYSVYNNPGVVYWQVSIRLAYSDDNGITWQDAGSAVSPSIETLVGPLTPAVGSIPANSLGIWQSEMSSLSYDPSAPANERWKLVWHQYLNANLVSYFVDYAWVSLKMAATPEELVSATPVKLFGGAGLSADNTNSGSPIFAPIGGAPLIQLNTDITNAVGAADVSELTWCIWAESGLHATSDALYLAIYCADASTVPSTGSVTEYVVYFRCPGPCDITNATGWEYIGRLLAPADAQAATGDHHFQAPALVEKNGGTYLLVTPVDTTTADDRYNGCRLYKLTDINSNQLERSGGLLVEYQHVDGDAGTHFGACDSYSGLDGGILLSQQGTVGTADTFQIYKSQVSLP